MTAVESAAALLRRAADRIEHLAKPLADHDGWHAETDDYDEDEWVIASSGPTVDTGHGKVMFGGQWTVARDVPENVARWAALVGPQVAGPLASWLREQAEFYDHFDCAVSRHAFALALALLGETPEKEADHV